jgi:hypothetical protein
VDFATLDRESDIGGRLVAYRGGFIASLSRARISGGAA